MVAAVIIIVIASIFFGFRKAARDAANDEKAKPAAPARPSSMDVPSSSSSTKPAAKGTPLEDARPLRRIDPESRKLLVEEIAKARAKRAPTTAVGGGAPVDQQLSPEYILTQTQAIMPLLKECYTEALKDDPALAGRLSLEIVIGGEPDVGGLVESSEILEGSTIKHAAMHECLRETMYALELVAPSEGGRYTVRTTMAFTPEPSGSSSR